MRTGSSKSCFGPVMISQTVTNNFQRYESEFSGLRKKFFLINRSSRSLCPRAVGIWKPGEQNCARSREYDRNATRTKSLCIKGIKMLSHEIWVMPSLHFHCIDNLIVLKTLDVGKEPLGGREFNVETHRSTSIWAGAHIFNRQVMSVDFYSAA